MVDKMIRNQPPPELDEEWWTALLSDEKTNRYPHDGQEKVVPHITGLEFSKDEQPAQKPSIDWDLAQSIYSLDEIVVLPVKGYNRGGILVGRDRLHGFVPLSHLLQIDCQTEVETRNQVLAAYVGREISLKLIECDVDRARVIFSERAALAGAGCRNRLLEDIQPGDCIQGQVTNIKEFGVFVDLGGVEGLIHVSELSWGRVQHPADVVKVGVKVNALVMDVEKERAKIALSIKRLHSNPWESVEDRYHPNQIVDAVITSIVPFGAFARLEEGLDGLIHTSEFAVEQQSIENRPILEVGQQIMARIITVDGQNQRMGLSLKL